MIGDEAFEELAKRLGRDRLNAFAVERGIPKSDPGWTGAVQMIPLLDALDERIERIQTVMDALPHAFRAAATEVVLKLADSIADASIERIESGGVTAIRTAVAGEITTTLVPAIQATAQSLEQRAVAFGNGAQAATEKLSATADDARHSLQSHGRLIYQHHLRGWLQTGLTGIGLAIMAAIGSHAFASHQCFANIEHAHAYQSVAQLGTLERTYCP